MKLHYVRLGFFALIFVVLTGVAASPAQAQLGIAAGANFDEFSDIDTDNGQATIDNASGFHVGVFYDLTMGPIGLRPGLVYVDVGEVDVEVDDIAGTVQQVDVNLFEVPIDVRYRLAIPLVSPYVLAGPVLRLADANDGEIEDSFNEFSMAGAVGAGVELSIPGTGLRLHPELRYQFGVSDFVDDFEVGGVDVTTEGSQLSTVMLRLGLSF